MLWDAAWDQQNVIEGKVYSDHIADIMSRSGEAPGPSAAPGTGAVPTPGGSTPVGPTSGGSTPSPPSAGGGGGGAGMIILTYL